MAETIKAGKGETVVVGKDVTGKGVGAGATDGGTITITGNAVGRQTTSR